MKKQIKRELLALGYHELDFKNFTFDGEHMKDGDKEVCVFSQDLDLSIAIIQFGDTEYLVPFNELFDMFEQLEPCFDCPDCQNEGGFMDTESHDPNSPEKWFKCECPNLIFKN